MRRVAALVAVLVVTLAAAAAGPAHAIETASFGLAPAGKQGRTALHEDVRPGKRTEDAVRVWNKTARPLTVTLVVQGASIDAKGQVHLGGNGGAAGWVKLGSSQVVLAPHGTADVPVVIEGPRKMPKGVSNAAVVAEADVAGSGNVAVVQRVALMIYAGAPAGSSLRAALGWAAWVAVALLLAVGVVVARRVRPWRRARAVDGPSRSAALPTSSAPRPATP